MDLLFLSMKVVFDAKYWCWCDIDYHLCLLVTLSPEKNNDRISKFIVIRPSYQSRCSKISMSQSEKQNFFSLRDLKHRDICSSSKTSSNQVLKSNPLMQCSKFMIHAIVNLLTNYHKERFSSHNSCNFPWQTSLYIKDSLINIFYSINMCSAT